MVSGQSGPAACSNGCDVPLTGLLSRHQRRASTTPTQVVAVMGWRYLFRCNAMPGVDRHPRTPVVSNLPLPSTTDALHLLDTGDVRWRAAADKVRRVLDKPIPLLIAVGRWQRAVCACRARQRPTAQQTLHQLRCCA